MVGPEGENGLSKGLIKKKETTLIKEINKNTVSRNMIQHYITSEHKIACLSRVAIVNGDYKEYMPPILVDVL